MFRTSRRLTIIVSPLFTVMPHPRPARIPRLVTIDLAVVVIIKPMEEPLNSSIAHSLSTARLRIAIGTTRSKITRRRRRTRATRWRRGLFKSAVAMSAMSSFGLRSRTLPIHSPPPALSVIPLHRAIRTSARPLAHHFLNALAHPLTNPLTHLPHPRSARPIRARPAPCDSFAPLFHSAVELAAINHAVVIPIETLKPVTPIARPPRPPFKRDRSGRQNNSNDTHGKHDELLQTAPLCGTPKLLAANNLNDVPPPLLRSE